MTTCHDWRVRGLIVLIAASSEAIVRPALAEDRAQQEAASRAGAAENSVSGVNPWSRWSLDLNDLTTLSVESAEAIARHRMGTILLDGLTTLSAQQAEVLARHRGRCLSLRGLQSLSEDAATQLANYRGALLLDGVTHLPDGTITVLARCAGPLSLCGLTSLSTTGARALASRSVPGLPLDGLAEVSVDVAAELANHRGPLRLNGLSSLSTDVARALAVHAGELSLASLTTLSVDAATDLARHRGGLSLDGLKSVSPAVATALARYGDVGDPSRLPGRDVSVLERTFCPTGPRPGQEGLLMLRGLHSLESPSLARKLVSQEHQRATRRGDAPVLRLDSLTSVSDEVLVILTGFPGTLSLEGFTTLSPQRAQMLVQHRGGLNLNGLSRISLDAAQVLSRYGDPWFLDGVNAYIGSAVGYYRGRADVSQCVENHLVLNGLRVLDCAALADKLVVQEEQRSRRHFDDPVLRLDQVSELSDDATRIIATFRGTLCLNGLRSLSLASAQALATHRGRLELNGLRVVSDEVATELIRHSGDLSLRGVSTVSESAADSLSGHAGVSLSATVLALRGDRDAADEPPLPDR